MRLFVAINLSPEINEYLQSIQVQLPDARMNKTRDFHLTLQFIGEVSPDQALMIQSALYHVFMPVLKLKLQGLGVFKSEGKVSAVYVEVEDSLELMRVRSEVEEQLAPLGFFNDKKFKPHLTLARVKECGGDFEDELVNIELMEKEFEVREFSLMESHLSPEGPRYEEVEGYKS